MFFSLFYRFSCFLYFSYFLVFYDPFLRKFDRPAGFRATNHSDKASYTCTNEIRGDHPNHTRNPTNGRENSPQQNGVTAFGGKAHRIHDLVDVTRIAVICHHMVNK